MSSVIEALKSSNSNSNNSPNRFPIALPDYISKPDTHFFLTKIIEPNRNQKPLHTLRIKPRVTYQGETDYFPLRQNHNKHPFEYLTFRWASILDFPERNYNWGILHTTNGQPVDAETLTIFQAEHYQKAVTGTYCTLTRKYHPCLPL